MTRRALLALLFTVASVAAWSEPAAAAGPWRGQVVDAETGKPLEGVVVLAQWDKLSPGAIHAAREFYDVDEVVTDVGGRFVIPERRVLTANPFVSLDGPILHMFKASYGPGLERGLPESTNIIAMRRLMEKQGVVFGMPRLSSRNARLNALPSWPSGAAPSKIPRWAEAIDTERVFLGLKPIHKSGTGGQP